MILLQLKDSSIPSIPFIWYREQQLCCPFELVYKTDLLNFNRIVNKLKAQYIISMNKEPTEFFIVVQRNILEDANLYICNHSYAFNKEHPIMKFIPPNYQKIYQYTTFNCPTNILNYKTDIQNLKMVEVGPVHIHDQAFSPPNVFNFKVNNSDIVNAFVSCISDKGSTSSTSCICLFIIVNEVNETNDDVLKEIMDTIKN